MNISEAFGRFLNDNSSIGAVTSYIMPQRLPDDAQYPAITYSQESDSRIDLLDSDSSELATASFVVNIYATAYSAARSLADIVRRECISATSLNSLTAQRIECIVDFDRYEAGPKMHSVSQTFQIWYLNGA